MTESLPDSSSPPVPAIALPAHPTAEDYVERWVEALRVLEQMTPHERLKHLDMHSWGRQTECGTVACLGGHCSRVHWFRARGFTSEFVCNEDGQVVLKFTGIQPDQFFGGRGFDVIFLGISLTYIEVVAKVKDHIAYLEAGGHPEYDKDAEYFEDEDEDEDGEDDDEDDEEGSD